MTPAAAMSLHESKLQVRTVVFIGCGASSLCKSVPPFMYPGQS